MITPFSAGLLYTLESDVCRRQILTYKFGPRAERMNVLATCSCYNNHIPLTWDNSCEDGTQIIQLFILSLISLTQ